MMTIRLRIISGEDEDFFREIEISGGATFLELHNFIQKLLNFDEGQMASFFMTDEEWQKSEEITLMDMAMDETSDSFIMADIRLNKFIFEKKQRLLYVFDFFNERNLFIETFEIDGSECVAPKCIRLKGDAPEQLDLSNLLQESMGEPSNHIDMDDDNINEWDLPEDDMLNDDMISYTDDLENF